MEEKNQIEGNKNQATNMYVDWNISGNSFNMILVDFYCEIQALGTYWAVLNWSNGYAGFQYNNNKHVLMFSIWDKNNQKPQIEYYTQDADKDDFDFSGEGTGKHIRTNVQWYIKKWYGMAVGTKSFGGNTYYMQWLRKSNNNDWQLIGIISFPAENLTLNKSSVFQEDFIKNKEEIRKCRVNRSYGRNSKTNAWASWNTGKVKSCYYPNENEPGIWDTKYNCNYGTGFDNGEEYVFIESGGKENDPNLLNEKFNFNFAIASPSLPASYPEYPKCIKSKYSGLFVSHNGSKVVQSSKKYWWNFVDSGNGYVYIKSSDNKKALTVTTMDDGSDLAFSDFESGNIKQQWKILEGGNGLSYIRPGAVLSKTMDIEGPSGDEGAIIQLWTYNSEAEQFKWYIL